MKKIIIISGPTASGKSALAIQLAQNLDAEIINADSFQVYKELEIGVNKPSQQDLVNIKHHLINNISVTEEWSIAHFLKECQKIIDKNQKNLIVIGGSTLYIDALINNYNLNQSSRSNNFDDWTNEALVTQICSTHPELINNSVKNNHKRLTRMYENILAKNINQKKLPKYNFFHILRNLEREKLYQKINVRVEAMFQAGWVNEVKKLAKQYRFNNHNAFKAIGYLDILNSGFIETELLKNKIKQKNRNYAKKQLTWCRNKFKFNFEYNDEIQLPILLKLVKNWLASIPLPQSLYIHIPFCKAICTYCDFPREILVQNQVDVYLKKLVLQIQGIKQKQKTIYIGGGTPNSLKDCDLEFLLASIQHLINIKTEFSIELNPEFVTLKQIKILLKYHVNRISLGVQSLNDSILKKINRLHTAQLVIEKLTLLKHYFDNISCDFIYNLPGMKTKDIDDIILFVQKNKIKHLSFYALEIKTSSILNKLNYQLDIDEESKQMLLIQKKLLKLTKLKRYEVSNWAVAQKYQSKHNLSYWNMCQWYGLGYGATSFFQNCYLTANGNNMDYQYDQIEITKKEYYQDIIMMGLRLKNGISLKQKSVNEAYQYFKNELKPFIIQQGTLIKIRKIDLLNEALLKII